MRRRIFLVGLSATLSTIPRVLLAESSMPLIGYLGADSSKRTMEWLVKFREGLKENGYIENQNVAIEYRYAEGRYDRFPELAAELVRDKVTVLVAATGNNGVVAAKEATSTVPIVFAVGVDPVKLGLAASFNRPGRNATGVLMYNGDLVRKRLELLGELVPKNRAIAVLVNPQNPNADTVSTDAAIAARALGRELHALKASADKELESAFAAVTKSGDAGILVGPDAFFYSRREKLIALAAQYSTPAIYEWREFVATGGLMSYAPDLEEVSHQLGLYTGKILRGASPAELPIEVPTKFDLTINLTTAKALGLSVSPSMLARADEVIE